jgi:hypothetical protein
LVWFHHVAEEGHVFTCFVGVPDCNKVVCSTVCEVHFHFLLSILLGSVQSIACEISSLGLEEGAMRLSEWDILTRENSHEFKYSLRTLISHFCVLQAY